MEALIASFAKDNAQRGSQALLWALSQERRTLCDPPAWSTDQLARWALRSTTADRPKYDAMLISLRFAQTTRLRAKLPPALIQAILLRAKSQGNECLLLAPDPDQQRMVTWALDRQFAAVKVAFAPV